MLKAAQWYRDKYNWSIIPVGKDKRPLIEWKAYQNRKPNDSELNQWWGAGDDNGIGIVCGEVSDLTVIDIDSYKETGAQAFNKMKSILGDAVTPGVISPRGGLHIYLRHCPELEAYSRALPGCEIQGNGHYVVAPPSIGSNNRPYEWRLKPTDCQPVSISQHQIECIIACSKTNSKERINCKPHAKPMLSFAEGSRDESLFSVANALIKGGMDEENALYVLEHLAISCNPPFPESEVQQKVKSAFERARNRERGLTQEVREWCLITKGTFLITNLYNDLGLITRDNKMKAVTILQRLEKEGLVVKHGKKRGEYRVIDSDCEKIEWWKSSDVPFDLKLPLGLNDLVDVFSKNLIVVAGEFDAGKTALLMNIAEMNMRHKNVWYFSSEMDGAEMKKRIRGFSDVPEEDFRKINFFDRVRDFEDVIRPDDVNIIDYFEVSDNFFIIADQFMKIYERLRKGVCIIALQKKQGADMGRGAEFSAEKPRLYLSVSKVPGEGQRIKIIKAKGWKNPDYNPNYKSRNFKIVSGCQLIATSGWEFMK